MLRPRNHSSVIRAFHHLGSLTISSTIPYGLFLLKNPVLLESFRLNNKIDLFGETNIYIFSLIRAFQDLRVSSCLHAAPKNDSCGKRRRERERGGRENAGALVLHLLIGQVVGVNNTRYG